MRQVKAAIARSKDGKKLKAKFIAKAEEALKEPPVTRTNGDFLTSSRNALRHLQTFGMAWLLEKDDRYLKRAREELLDICGFADWNPSHFLDTAGTTLAVAIGYDWFYKELNDVEKKACVSAILDKGLKPGLAQLKGNPVPPWPNRISNWNIVCNAGLMIGALAVAEEPSDLPRQVFRRCLNSVPTGFRGYSPDGSWDEGPGYWSYATEYVSYLLSALKTAVGSEFGLGDLPGLRRSGLFRMHAEGSALTKDKTTCLFNYSDCDETHSGAWCMRWLSRRYRRPQYNWLARHENQATAMDVFWFSSSSPPKNRSIPRNAMFRGLANVAMFRGKWSDKRSGFRPWTAHTRGTVFLGIRAGANSRDDSHGHLDLGSFVLDGQQQRWAIDIPPVSNPSSPYRADYDLPGYFDIDMEKRFRYYRTGTIGHNTLVINGWNQPLGIQTEIVGFGETLDLVVAVVDLTAAYPDCLRVRRGFALIKRRHVLIVDELTPKQEMTVAWQMHTRAKATRGVTSRLTHKYKTVTNKTVTKKVFVRILEPEGAEFDIQRAHVTQPKEAPNTGIRKLVATLPSIVHPTRISVYLSAQRGPTAPLPEPLEWPLWTWIEWAGKHQHPNQELL